MEPQHIIQPNEPMTAAPVVIQTDIPVAEPVLQPPQAIAADSATKAALTQQLFATDEPRTEIPDQVSVRSKKSKGIALTAGGIVVVALIIGAFVLYANVAKANATKQAQKFVSSLNKGDNKAAYAMGSPALQKDQSEAQFASGLGDVTASKPSFDKQTTNVNGSKATYVAFENGLPQDADGNTQATFTIQLVKSGLTGWKVDSVDVQ